MQKQLVILSLMMVPLISVTIACSTDRSSSNPVVAVAEKLIPSALDSQGGVQLTIQLKPTRQHPQISEADRDRVQRVIEGRTNGLGVKGAYITSIGTERILVQLPGLKDSKQAERVLGGTAQIEFREQKAGTEGQLEAEMAILNKAKVNQVVLKKSQDRQAIATNQVAIEKQYTEIGKLFGKAVITGEQIESANPVPLSSPRRWSILPRPEPPSNQAWNIAIEFDAPGSDAFAQLTKKLAGTGRSIGVFVDNDPISTPTVGPTFAATGITGGKAVITGNFTAETAQDLAIQLSSGALPVPIEIIENRIIPPK